MQTDDNLFTEIYRKLKLSKSGGYSLKYRFHYKVQEKFLGKRSSFFVKNHKYMAIIFTLNLEIRLGFLLGFNQISYFKFHISK